MIVEVFSLLEFVAQRKMPISTNQKPRNLLHRQAGTQPHSHADDLYSEVALAKKANSMEMEQHTIV